MEGVDAGPPQSGRFVKLHSQGQGRQPQEFRRRSQEIAAHAGPGRRSPHGENAGKVRLSCASTLASLCAPGAGGGMGGGMGGGKSGAGGSMGGAGTGGAGAGPAAPGVVPANLKADWSDALFASTDPKATPEARTAAKAKAGKLNSELQAIKAGAPMPEEKRRRQPARTPLVPEAAAVPPEIATWLCPEMRRPCQKPRTKQNPNLDRSRQNPSSRQRMPRPTSPHRKTSHRRCPVPAIVAPEVSPPDVPPPGAVTADPNISDGREVRRARLSLKCLLPSATRKSITSCKNSIAPKNSGPAIRPCTPGSRSWNVCKHTISRRPARARPKLTQQKREQIPKEGVTPEGVPTWPEPPKVGFPSTPRTCRHSAIRVDGKHDCLVRRTWTRKREGRRRHYRRRDQFAALNRTSPKVPDAENVAGTRKKAVATAPEKQPVGTDVKRHLEKFPEPGAELQQTGEMKRTDSETWSAIELEDRLREQGTNRLRPGNWRWRDCCRAPEEEDHPEEWEVEGSLERSKEGPAKPS